METLPLDKKQISYENNGKKEHLSALHPKWLEKMVFVSYTAPPIDSSDRGQYEEWLERVKFIAEDLHWLLQLPHDKFWCQAVFNESLHSVLDSYLRFAPRSYDIIYDLPEDGRHHHNEVHALVFMTCVRMATHKESKENHITPSVFGDILYENFIFDVPKLLDLCVLYAQGNAALLTKMITNIFTQQPKYSDDLRATIPTIIQVLDNIQETCGYSSSFSPEKLHSGTKESRLVTMAMKEFQDVIFYVADTAMTVCSFLEVYAPACSIFHEFHFEQRLAGFYEIVLPELQASLKVRECESTSHRRLLKQKLHQAKKSLQKIFHAIVAHTCIQPILENSGSEDVAYLIEDFLHTMSAVLGERRFLADYESRYSFQEYEDILCQTSCDIDETQMKYIHDAINSAYSTFGKRKKPKGAMSAGGRTSPDGSPGPLDEGAMGGACAAGGGVCGGVGGATAEGEESIGEADGACGGIGGADYSACGGDAYQMEDYDSQGACAPKPSRVEMDSLITSIKDLLPELGEGFIEILLEEFGYDQEQAINAVLTDKLPPSLNDIDRFLDRENPEESTPSLVDQRANIYDNDQFDVFSRRNVDMSRIHKGKREDTVSLDDKSTVKQMKATYDAYGSRDQASMYENLPDYDYEDEYDDTYDTHNVGAQDEDSADELTARRPFVVPRALQARPERQEREVSEESEEESAPRDEFVQDPALLRAAAEQRRWAQSARGRGGRIRQQHDVVGKAKGQGQEGDVLKNRRFKEKNKAVRGNHNRRAGADKKRRRGMMAV